MATVKTSYTLKLQFILKGFDCPSDEITELLGVQPTQNWDKGDILRTGASPRKFSTWILLSPTAPENSTVSEQLSGLKRLVPDIDEKLRVLSVDTVVTISCVVYAYEYWPAINLQAEEIDYLSRISAEFDVDLYDQINV